MEFLDQGIKFIQENLLGASATIAIVLEFAFRLIKTEKPLSILHLVAGVAKKLADGFKLLGDFLDKVLPQKLK